MNKKMLEDFKSKQMIIECDKEIIMKELADMEENKKYFRNGIPSKLKESSNRYIEGIKDNIKRIASEQAEVVAAISSLASGDEKQDECLKKVLKFRFIDGLSIEGVGKAMNISNMTVHRHLNKAYAILGVE